MIDAHCHVDLYAKPADVAAEARRAGVLTVAVTNLPSAFDRAYPHALRFSNLRLAVGLHPLLATEHAPELRRFEELAEKTSYIGEVGLDFGPDAPDRNLQIASLRFVLKLVRGKGKFITLHSRKAETKVLELLAEAGNPPAVFHWFSGPVALAEEAAATGHFFSINPAMIRTQAGKRLLAAVPSSRVLTETDGPFVRIGARVCSPPDVALVERELSERWGVPFEGARAIVRRNFMGLVRRHESPPVSAPPAAL